jgi:hypothetical protein
MGKAQKSVAQRPTTLSKETYYTVKRDLLYCQKRPTILSKETYHTLKRDLLKVSGPETHCTVKRDLLYCQKTPTILSKETYHTVKRDLLYSQKRPTAAWAKTKASGPGSVFTDFCLGKCRSKHVVNTAHLLDIYCRKPTCQVLLRLSVWAVCKYVEM